VRGRTLSHDRVVEEINQGGMGIVHRALDSKLDREVLRQNLVSEPVLERGFIDETVRLVSILT
jgi:hypothetical protein